MPPLVATTIAAPCPCPLHPAPWPMCGSARLLAAQSRPTPASVWVCSPNGVHTHTELQKVAGEIVSNGPRHPPGRLPGGVGPTRGQAARPRGPLPVHHCGADHVCSGAGGGHCPCSRAALATCRVHKGTPPPCCSDVDVGKQEGASALLCCAMEVFLERVLRSAVESASTDALASPGAAAVGGLHSPAVGLCWRVGEGSRAHLIV
jgi:hypothetical protein